MNETHLNPPSLVGIGMGVLNPVVDGPVPQDGPYSWYTPRTTADFTRLGITAPTYLHGYQEASGNIVSLTTNTLDLVPGFTSSAPLYQQTVTGWTRKGVTLIDSDAGNGFKAANSTGPNNATTSWASLVYARIRGAAATNRNVCGNHGIAGGDVEATLVLLNAADSKLHAFGNDPGGGAGANVAGVFTATGGYDVPILMVYDRNAGAMTIYTHEEKIGGAITYFAAPTNGGWGIGSDDDFGATFAADMDVVWSCMWTGTDAELDQTEVAAIFDALNIDRGWTVAFDGPGHYFVPTTDAEYDYLGIARAHSTWTCQETSGDLIGVTNAAGTDFDLADVNSPGYAEAAYTGWSRKSVRIDHATTDAFLAAAGVGPDPSATSVLWIGYFDVTITTSSSTRGVLVGGGAAAASDLSANISTDSGGLGYAMTNCMAVTSTGTDDIKSRTIFEPIVLQYDRTNSKMIVYTEQEKVVGTYSGSVTDGNKGIGFSIVAAAGTRCTWLACWSGADAELTTTQVKALLTTLRWSPTWTP